MCFKAMRHRMPTRCRQWRGSATFPVPAGWSRRGGGAPGRWRSAPEARIVARGAAVGGGGWGQPWHGGCAAEVPNLGRRKGGSPGGRGGPLPTPRCPPVFSEAVVCRTPRFADCDAPKRPMVAYPCRPEAATCNPIRIAPIRSRRYALHLCARWVLSLHGAGGSCFSCLVILP